LVSKAMCHLHVLCTLSLVCHLTSVCVSRLLTHRSSFYSQLVNTAKRLKHLVFSAHLNEEVPHRLSHRGYLRAWVAELRVPVTSHWSGGEMSLEGVRFSQWA
jgi:hypothetical protein